MFRPPARGPGGRRGWGDTLVLGLGLILKGDPPTWSVPKSEGEPGNERWIDWNSYLGSISGLDDAGRGVLQNLQAAEDVLMSRVVDCLAMNPEIQDSRHLFYAHRAGANAFDGRTISEFWSLTSSIRARGTTPWGFYFEHYTPSGQSYRLSDSASYLMNVAIEYVVARVGSFWPVERVWEFSVNVALPVTVRKTLLVRWWQSNDRAKLSSRALAVCDHLARTIRFEPAAADPNTMSLFLTLDRATRPVFLTSLRDAGLFQFNALHQTDHKRVLKHVEQLNSLPAALRFRSKGRRPPVAGAVLQTTLRQHERAAALRLLAVIADRTNETLNGIYAVSHYAREQMVFRRFNTGSHTDAVPWYMYDLETPGPMIAAALDPWEKRSVANRFLTLLFIANQPVAPLLAAWKPRSDRGCHPASLLQTVADLLGELNREWGGENGPIGVEVRYHLERGGDGHDPNAIWVAPDDGLAVVITGLEGISPPAFARELYENAPEYKLEDQLPGLNSFLRLLVALQGRRDDYATLIRAPAVWDEFADRATDPESAWVKELIEEIMRSAEQAEDGDD
jgi:hypothetical protein